VESVEHTDGDIHPHPHSHVDGNTHLHPYGHLYADHHLDAHENQYAHRDVVSYGHFYADDHLHPDHHTDVSNGGGLVRDEERLPAPVGWGGPGDKGLDTDGRSVFP
jgi:hypothetical protein